MEQYCMNELTDIHLVYGAAYIKVKEELKELIDIICASVHNGY